MRNPIGGSAQDQLFRAAPTDYGWLDEPVEESTIRALYDLMKWGPTSANSIPVQFVRVRSKESKAELAVTASEKNGRRSSSLRSQ